ncbi:MAG: hypothetical protein HY898_36360 [Deltaproteobacteria bacterium]|nr:hypothetical protein [Deltaproteobacteria bacterium]
MRFLPAAVALLSVGSLVACASGPGPQSRFQSAVEEIARRDRAGDWNADACHRLSDEIGTLAAGELAGPAHLHAGLVLQRCGDHEQARARMQAAVTAEPSLQIARAQLALYEYDRSPMPASLDRAIAELQKAVTQRPDPDLSADLGRLLLVRNRGAQGPGASDASRAREHLEQALLFDPNHAAALHQLASYYVAQSRVPHDAMGSTLNLEQARAICLRIVQHHPSYAPVYNTLGRIDVETGELDAAATSFERARSLDDTFVDAHLNLGSVSLTLRMAARAEEAFRRAIVIRPSSYDAWLGLAVALRMKATPEQLEQEVANIEHCLDRCAAIDAARPESWFNRAILYRDRAAARPDPDLRHLSKALELLSSFLARAGQSPMHSEKVRQAHDLQRDIKQLMVFIQESRKVR